jgi:hypothetical protein
MVIPNFILGILIACYNKNIMEPNQLNQNSFEPMGLPPMPPKTAPQSLIQSEYERPAPPPPPPPEIVLRTMKSDLGGLKESGGAIPTPKPFTPPEIKRVIPSGTPPPSLPKKIAPMEFGLPNQEKKESTTIIEEPAETKEKSKKIVLWVVAGIIIIGVGLAGYFIVFPMLFPPQIPSPPAPALTEPELTVPEIPEAEVLPPTETPLTHQSLLRSSDTIATMELTSIDLLSLTNALQQEAKKTLPSGTLAEIILSDVNRRQIPALDVLPSLIPALLSETVKKLFEEDFTAALYYDANGVWPAYILKLSLKASIVEAQATIRELEASPNFENLFLASPGTADTAGFKDGQANNIATRYLAFSKKGAALNFAWSNDKLIISTSYNGLKKILNNL